jgi:hypothetical protein
MAGRSLGSILVGSLLLLAASGCDAPEPEGMQLREGIDVLPFIPVCTACMVWTFGGVQWALHRAQPSLLETDELDAPEDVEAATGPIELVAARRSTSAPWRFAADAESYELGGLRIYVWSASQSDGEEVDDEAEELDAPGEAGSDKPKRSGQLWIVRNDGEGWCAAPSFGGTPLPEEKELDELVDRLDIERQPCTEVM